MWNVKFYYTERGDSPVVTFIREQDEATYAKILRYIMFLKQTGPFLKPPYIKKLQNNLYELRISASPPIRIFYSMHKNEYYLVHAFKKKTQKTPQRELQTAIDRIKKML